LCRQRSFRTAGISGNRRINDDEVKKQCRRIIPALNETIIRLDAAFYVQPAGLHNTILRMRLPGVADPDNADAATRAAASFLQPVRAGLFFVRGIAPMRILLIVPRFILIFLIDQFGICVIDVVKAFFERDAFHAIMQHRKNYGLQAIRIGAYELPAFEYPAVAQQIVQRLDLGQGKRSTGCRLKRFDIDRNGYELLHKTGDLVCPKIDRLVLPPH
jgi:hypothetical protein